MREEEYEVYVWMSQAAILESRLTKTCLTPATFPSLTSWSQSLLDVVSGRITEVNSPSDAFVTE